MSSVFNTVSHALGTDGSGGGLLGMAAQLDKSVHNAIPGGWATLGTAALAIAAPYLAPALAGAGGALDAGTLATADGFAQAAGYETAAEALDAGVDAASLGLPAGTTAAGVTDAATALATTAGGTGTGLTSGAVDTALQQGTPLQSLLNSAGTGALTGGTMGGVKAAVTGQDPLQAILSGAITGGLTGGALDSLTSPALASQMGWSAPLSTPVASALLAATKAIAGGADPKSVLENTAISGALSSLGGQANSAMSGSIPSSVANAIIGAGTGAAGAAIKGGNIGTGAETGAVGATVGSGLSALAAPSASITPAPVTDNSTPYDPSTSLTAAQLKAEADILAGNASNQIGGVQGAQSTLDAATSTTTDAYNQAKTDQTALDNALTSTGYTDSYNALKDQQQNVSGLYSSAINAQTAYTNAQNAFNANPTQANYDAYKAASDAYTTAVNSYTTANTSFQTASTNLQNLYNSSIAPLQTAAQNSTSALTQNLQQYGNDQSALNTVANSLGTTLSGLSQISNGQLASGMNIPDVAVSAPSAQIGPQPSTDNLTQTSSQIANLANTIPVTNPDGSTGYLSSTGAVYNADGSLNQQASATTGATFTGESGQVAGTGTGIVQGAKGTVTVTGAPDSFNNAQPISSGSGTAETPTTSTTGAGETGTSGTGSDVSANDIVANIIGSSTTPSTSTTAGTSTTPSTSTTAGTSTTPSTSTTAGTSTTPSTSTTAGTGSSNTGAGTAAGVVAGIIAGSGGGSGSGTGTGSETGTGSGSGSGTGTSTGTTGTSTTGTSNVAATKKTITPGTASFSKGTQITDPLNSIIAAQNAAAPAPTQITPLDYQEIQQAKNGGIIHRVDGGPVFLKGHDAAHASLFGLKGSPLSSAPHLQNGGQPDNMMFQDRTLPEGHNPQFFSEGGLNSLHNKFVRGDGDGTSDSVPAMLANGEFVIPADVVSGLGNGSNEAGAKVLDSFLKTVREHKQKHDSKHLPPDSKGPLAYLLQAQKKARA